MKKITAVLLIMAIILSLSACGSPQRVLTSTKWVDVYLGYKLELNKDNTAKFDDDLGSWSLEENTLTVYVDAAQYNGTVQKTVHFDVVEENGITLLKSDGESDYLAGKSVFCPEDKVDEIIKSLVKDMNETVSTDIVEFSIKNAEFSFSAFYPDIGNAFIGDVYYIDRVVLNPDKACLPCSTELSDQMPSLSTVDSITARKGKVLLCHDFIIKNNDREEFYTFTNNNLLGFYVRYNGEVYHVNSYDGYTGDGWEMDYRSPYCITSTDSENFMESNKYLEIDAGSSMEIRKVGICPFEPENLTDSFELIVSLENSSGENEFFIYSVN